MRALSLLVALVPTVALAQPSPKSKPLTPPCQRPELRQTSGATKPGFHKLGDLPPAKPIYTVVRAIDGCPRPVSVQRR